MLMRKYPMGVLIFLFILGWPLLFLCVSTFSLGLRN